VARKTVIVSVERFTLSRKHWLVKKHLVEYASNAPHINVSRVVCRAEQDIWRSIPECHDLVGVSLSRNRLSSSESKVGQFQFSNAIDQEVLRL
jgi:hypothetical protein